MEHLQSEEKYKSKLYLKQDLQIIKLSCFENEKIHAIFNDNTTIIVYSGFSNILLNNNLEYFTYFHSDNQKFRMKTENPLKLYNIGLKLYLILNVYSIFSNNIPNIILPYLSKYEKEYSITEESVLESKKEFIIKSYWINEDSYFERDDKGEYFLINSYDYNTKLYFLKNLRVIKIEYLQLLSVEKHDVKEENNYLKAVKYYSINNIPSIWNIPLKLLISHFNLDSVKNGNFNSKIDIKKLKIDHNNSIITYREFISNLPELSKTEVMTHNFPNSEEEVNPIVFIFSREQKLKFLYNQNFTFLITDEDEIDIICNEYPHLVIYTINKMSHLYYQASSTGEVVNLIEIEKYAKILYKDRKEENQSIPKNDDLLNEIIIEICDIKKYYKNEKIVINNLDKDEFYKFTPLENNKFINYKQFDFIFDGDEVLFFNQLSNIGDFYAFKNKAIRVHFNDRTNLKIDSMHEKISILNKYGEKYTFVLNKLNDGFTEFINYYDYALQFYNFCFMTREEKREIQNNLKFVNEISKASIDRIQNHIKFLHNDYLITGNEISKNVEANGINLDKRNDLNKNYEIAR